MSYSEVRQKVDLWMNAFYGFFFNGLKDSIATLGRFTLFSAQSLKLTFVKPYRFRELVSHMEFVANGSIFIICLTGFFTGAALAFQVFLGFEIVNATSLVGPTVGLGISRELGPVLTGMIVAARAGGAMTARLGTMRVSEQIDALEVMGIHPQQYLITPRLLAAIISMPLLNGVFVFVAMLGAYLLVVHVLQVDAAIFIEKTQLWLEPRHLNEGFFKATIFGFIFGSVCCYQGFNADGGAKGVGDATNRGVVYSMVMIIVSDFFLMKIIDYFYIITGLK